MRNIIIIILLFIGQTPLWAQLENIPASISMGGGIDVMTNQDLSASPLTYDGFGLPIGGNGFSLSDKRLNHFEIRLILPAFTNNYTLASKAGIK